MSNKNQSVGPGIAGLAKRTNVELNKPVRLQSGHFVVLHAVSASLIEEARMIVKNPPVPMFRNESKDRDEPNPSHPDYIKALEEAEQKRNIAATEAMIMFGVELCDADGSPAKPPQDDLWLKKLRFMERRGFISLEGYDLKDEIDQEFLYKKYFAVSAPDLMTLAKATQLDEEMVADAAATFPDN